MEGLSRISTLLSFGVAVIAEGVLAAILRARRRSSDHGETGIEIWVYNCAEVSEADLKSARREFGEVFRVSGIKTVWREVPATDRQLRQHPPDDQPLDPLRHSDIIVKILPGPAPGLRAGARTGELISGGLLLASVHCPADAPAIISISLDRAQRTAEKEGLLDSLPELLGCVLARQIAQALLGTDSHSAQGIMLGHWSAEELRLAGHSRLRFTAEQAEVIRVAAGSRNSGRQPLEVQATAGG